MIKRRSTGESFVFAVRMLERVRRERGKEEKIK